MVRVSKTNEPNSLRTAINRGATDYELHLDKRTKVKLRTKLLQDQGYVCCYCLKQIPEKYLPKSKIEHFKSQTGFPELQLEFRNLFIACNGVGNIVGKTCDTQKGGNELTSFNLLTSNLATLIKYTKNGTIFSTDIAIKEEINDILNLNDENLRKAREEIYTAIERIKKKCGSKGNYANSIAKVISEWSSKDSDGRHKPYYAVALYYLNK